MTGRRALAAAVLAAALLGGPGEAAADRATDARFQRLADEFLGRWLARQPHVATRLGVHDRDDRLVPVTEASLAEERGWMRQFRQRLHAVPRARLSFERALDHDVLAARVERELLNLEVIRPFETNPNAYLDLVAGSVQALLQRDFAPLCVRVRSAARRLHQVPEVLRAARILLRRPPRVATETAISQYEGVLRFYRVDLPEAAAGCREPTLQAELAEALGVATPAVEGFVAFLREDLLPRSTGSFALGRETYQRKLWADEMERTPVDSLLARARAALDDTQRRMAAAAERAFPGAGVAAALDSLGRDAPAADQLVASVAGQLDSIRAFLRARDLITLPPRENLIVRETPPFQRGLSFASMSSPGVWERQATEAYYNVTPVDTAWTAQQQRDHLAFFNRWAAPIVSVHEALPGHYYQFLALQKVPSRIRQALPSSSNAEGWAHYCEQMAIEEGFGGGDPRFELAQLSLAIRRIGRFIAGISLHTQGMTYEEAVRLFEEQCFMAPVNAAREARRGTMDPTYLVYTLGKWRILDLREEVRARLGARYTPRLFHDAFLRQGAAPLPVARAGLLREIDALAAGPGGDRSPEASGSVPR